MNRPLNSSPRLALFCLCALLAFSVACNRGPSQPGAATGQPAAKRYSLKGRVISVDKNAATANIASAPRPTHPPHPHGRSCPARYRPRARPSVEV